MVTSHTPAANTTITYCNNSPRNFLDFHLQLRHTPKFHYFAPFFLIPPPSIILHYNNYNGVNDTISPLRQNRKIPPKTASALRKKDFGCRWLQNKGPHWILRLPAIRLDHAIRPGHCFRHGGTLGLKHKMPFVGKSFAMQTPFIGAWWTFFQGLLLGLVFLLEYNIYLIVWFFLYFGDSIGFWSGPATFGLVACQLLGAAGCLRFGDKSKSRINWELLPEWQTGLRQRYNSKWKGWVGFSYRFCCFP